MVVGDAVHRVIPLIVPAGDHRAAGDIQALDILRVVPIRVLDADHPGAAVGFGARDADVAAQTQHHARRQCGGHGTGGVPLGDSPHVQALCRVRQIHRGGRFIQHDIVKGGMLQRGLDSILLWEIGMLRVVDGRLTGLVPQQKDAPHGGIHLADTAGAGNDPRCSLVERHTGHGLKCLQLLGPRQGMKLRRHGKLQSNFHYITLLFTVSSGFLQIQALVPEGYF